MKEYQKEVLKAWIDGAEIQYKTGDTWGDCYAFGDCNKVYFNDDMEYRIKPKEIVTITEISLISAGQSTVHSTHTFSLEPNLKLTWSPDGKTLLKAEVI